jgi:hypothetical protein
MELRKYKELKEYPKLRVLKKPESNKERIGSFVTLIIMIIVIIAAIAVVNSDEEPEAEETLQEFVERAIDEKPKKQEKFELAKTTSKQIARIKELLNLDVSEFRWVISNYDVRHIWYKPAHGINKEDFSKIYSVLNAYDSFTLAEKKRKDIVTIELYKHFEYRLKCIVEVRTGKKELVILTMYKNW